MINFLNKITGKLRGNRLPLLRFVSDNYPETDLSKTLFIACQHILGTTYDLFEELFKKGLRPEQVYLIGKCYSTNRKTYERFSKRGVNISDLSYAFNSQISFDEQFGGYINKFLNNIKKQVNINNYEKVVILDDGGGLILFANDFFKKCDNFSGIEQTSSGYEKLKEAKLSFPVFNIARSKAKLEYESPMIAELIFEKIKSYIRKNNLKDPKILVIGQGYIGKGITDLLKKDFQVNGCDKIANKCDYAGNYKEKIGDFDILVGAAGQSVLSAGDFGSLKNNVILISASSSDREFSAVYLRALESQTDNPHKDFDINGIKLLNAGFPINFDGAEHSLNPDKIQLTRALLLAGIYESVTKDNEKGLIELDNQIQDKIIKEFQRNL